MCKQCLGNLHSHGSSTSNKTVGKVFQGNLDPDLFDDLDGFSELETTYLTSKNSIALNNVSYTLFHFIWRESYNLGKMIYTIEPERDKSFCVV